jgi:hypothetical protein
MLAPAHRPRWISWRSAEIRAASMKPKLKLDLSSPDPDLCRCSRAAGSSKRPPARTTASRPSAIEQKSSAACRISAVACQGVIREAEPSPLARLCPAKPVCGYSCLLGFWKSPAAQSAKALSHTSFDSEEVSRPDDGRGAAAVGSELVGAPAVGRHRRHSRYAVFTRSWNFCWYHCRS